MQINNYRWNLDTLLYYMPEKKEQWKQWKHYDTPPPKKAKAVKSADKIMELIFWYAKGILMINYVPTKSTINGKYYTNLLDQLDKNIHEKRHGLWKKKIIFYQDNACPYQCVVTMTKVNKLKYNLLLHPPYLTDQVPSDFHIFEQLKKIPWQKEIFFRLN